MGSLLNVRETAMLLGVSEATVRNWSDAGILAARRLPGSGFRRFDHAQVEALRQRMLEHDAIGSSRRRGRRAAIPTLDDLRRRRREILAIAKRRGAHNVRVFGSVSQGTAGPDSDVDFVVDMEPEHMGIDYFGLHLDLEEALHRSVDLVIANDSTIRITSGAVPL